MNVSDEAKLFVVRQKLLEAERTIYEANKIIAFIGGEQNVSHSDSNRVGFLNGGTLDTDVGVDGLYPGQLPDTQMVCELSTEEQECVE